MDFLVNKVRNNQDSLLAKADEISLGNFNNYSLNPRNNGYNDDFNYRQENNQLPTGTIPILPDDQDRLKYGNNLNLSSQENSSFPTPAAPVFENSVKSTSRKSFDDEGVFDKMTSSAFSSDELGIPKSNVSSTSAIFKQGPLEVKSPHNSGNSIAQLSPPLITQRNAQKLKNADKPVIPEKPSIKNHAVLMGIREKNSESENTIGSEGSLERKRRHSKHFRVPHISGVTGVFLIII